MLNPVDNRFETLFEPCKTQIAQQGFSYQLLDCEDSMGPDRHNVDLLERFVDPRLTEFATGETHSPW